MGFSKHIKIKGSEEYIAKIIHEFSDVIVSTMGPGGHNVILQSAYGVESTDDGVTVSRHIRPRVPFLSAISNLITDASSSTVGEVGDGTTTTVCLLDSLYSEWAMNKEVFEKVDKVAFFEGMEAAVHMIVEFMKKKSKRITVDGEIDRDSLFYVANIACNGNTEMATMMSELIYNAGVNGRIVIKQNVKNVTTSENYKGYTFQTEALGRQHMRDRIAEKQILENPLFIIRTEPFTTAEEITPILNAWKNDQKLRDKDGDVRPLVIMAAELVGGARSLISANAEREPIFFIKPPFGGQAGWEIMSDVQHITGTLKVYSDTFGSPLDSFGEGLEGDGMTEATVWKEFGTAEKCIITPNQCSIVPLDSFSPKSRIEFLTSRIDDAQDETEVQFQKDRIAALDCGVGVVYVGAHSEAEKSRIEDHIDDVQRACFTALKGGVVPGAGRALFRSGEHVYNEMNIEANLATELDDKRHQGYFEGIALVTRAVQYPAAQIMANYEGDSNVKKQISFLNDLKMDYRLATFWGGWGADGSLISDTYESGIIDPTLVCCATLVNAVSVAKQLIGAKYMLVEDKESSTNQGYSSDDELPEQVDKNFVKAMYELMDNQ